MSSFRSLPKNPLNKLTKLSKEEKFEFIERLCYESISAELTYLESYFRNHNYNFNLKIKIERETPIPLFILNTLVNKMKKTSLKYTLKEKDFSSNLTLIVELLIDPTFFRGVYQPINKETYNLLSSVPCLNGLIYQTLNTTYEEYIENCDYPVFMG